MLRSARGIGLAALLVTLLVIAAGCTSPAQPGGSPQVFPVVTATLLPAEAVIATTVPVQTTQPAPPVITAAVTTPVNTTIATTIPTIVPSTIPEAALNAKIVDARNHLEMLMDSNVADTIIVHPDPTQNCEVKKSKELGYLIDMTTGDSTFVKGNYWSIDAGNFSSLMRTDHEYVIIHTHPRMWVTCAGSGILNYYSFSIGDLEAVANMTEQGYHVQKLIAIADKDYRIWPYVADDWRSRSEIRAAVKQIEITREIPYSYYDPVFDQTFYDVDNLMPFLADELEYHYTINQNIIT